MSIDLIFNDTAIRIALVISGSFISYFTLSLKVVNAKINHYKRLLPNRSDTFYNRIDFVFTIATGSLIGFVFFSPTTYIAALSAGFSWPAAYRALSAPVDQRTEHHDEH